MKLGLIFDAGGTLINKKKAVIRAYREVAFELTGKKLSKAKLQSFFGLSDAEILKQLGLDSSEKTVHLLHEKILRYAKNISCYPGVENMLKELKALGCHLSVITSKKRDVFENDVAATKLKEYFDVIICQEDTLYCKPNPSPLFRSMILGRRNSDELLYIGDTVFDQKCAEAANIRFAQALWGNPTLLKNTYDSFSHPEDVIAWVKKQKA